MDIKDSLAPIMRFLIPVTTAICIWVGSTVVQLQKEIHGLQVEMQYVREFNSKPRFTQEDFRDQIEPIKQRLSALEKANDVKHNTY